MSIDKTDFEKIHNLLARYCHVTDCGSAEDIAKLFWEDAVLEFNGRFQGTAEIRASYQAWIEKMRNPVEGLRHLIYAPVIENEEAHATASCYFDADGVSKKTGAAIKVRGIYEDKLEKRGHEWRFAERRIIVD